jgi:O-antigen ligase
VLAAALVACGGVLSLRLASAGRGALNAGSLRVLIPWIGAALICSLTGLDPASGLQVVGMMLLAASFHMALVRYYGEPGVARTVVASYLAAGLAASAAALAMLALRRPALLWALNHGRAAGPFVTANQCAAFLVMFVFVALGAALATASRRLRALAICSAGVGLLALLATVSQSGYLGAAAGAAFLLGAFGLRRWAYALCAAIVAAPAAAALRPAALHNPADAVNRLRTWTAGWRVAELFPLVGVGPMAYWRVYPEVRPPNGAPPGTFGALHPHNAYLSLAGELGFAGLAACALGGAAFVRQIRRDLAAADPARRRFTLGVCAGFVGVLVQGMFDTIGIVQMTFVWIPFAGLALAAARRGLP